MLRSLSCLASSSSFFFSSRARFLALRPIACSAKSPDSPIRTVGVGADAYPSVFSVGPPNERLTARPIDFSTISLETDFSTCLPTDLST